MLVRIIGHAMLSFLRKKKLKRKASVIIGRNVSIAKNCIFEGRNKLTGNNKVRNIKMGYASYINESVYLESCVIGRYSCIGPYSKVILGTHPTSDYVSIHPAFYSTRKQVGFTYVTDDKFQEFASFKYDGYSVSIGNDVWIGACVTILDGVSIGDGAIVVSGAVVTQNVAPYTVVGGVPAKLIRYRFDSDTIKKIEKIKWWDKDVEWLSQYADSFDSVEKFIKLMEKKNEE